MALNRRRLDTWIDITNHTESDSEKDDFGNAVDVDSSERAQACVLTLGGSEMIQDRDTRILSWEFIFGPEVTVDALSTFTWTDKFGVDHTGRAEGEPTRFAGLRGPSHIKVSVKEFVA